MKIHPFTFLFVAIIFLAGCAINPATSPADNSSTNNDLSGQNLVKSEAGNYNGQDLSVFPADALTKTDLTILDISKNRITSLPAELNRLTKLEVLDVSDNLLTGSLVAEIGRLTQLTRINAANNQLTGIPAEIGNLKNLAELDLSGNQIDTFPNELAEISGNLKKLDLGGNKFTVEKIAELQKLLPDTQIVF